MLGVRAQLSIQQHREENHDTRKRHVQTGSFVLFQTIANYAERYQFIQACVIEAFLLNMLASHRNL